MIGLIISFIIGCIIGCVTGILVFRRNKSKSEKVIQKVKEKINK